jgi:hypothetical protein
MKYAVLRRKLSNPRKWIQCRLSEAVGLSYTDDIRLANKCRDDLAKEFPRYLYIVVEVPSE